MTIQKTLPTLLFLFSATCTVSAADDEINFSRDILPLLSENCFKCHGPDEANRESDLRLDKHETAIAKLESGHTAVVAGKSGQSELFKRLVSDDADIKMPPPDSGKKLTAAQIDLIRKWIDGGAQWTGHWAFQSPTAPKTPAPVKDWRANNPIDHFVNARLATANLTPEDRAAKETLIRRATLDLTGLPATIKEIDNFLADDSEQAFERVVDRLLASSKYGEHMARYWLDAARYGDTHGLHLDNERPIWLYRNWVIESFNRNQSFDEFTIEQIAGDLLPEPTLQQRVATGFNRCNVTTSEGGSIDDEYYMRYAVDRVETTATVWLGLTAGCAACHDHKFDPLTQKEFYQLFSYYFSLTERAMDGNALLPPPSVQVPSDEQVAQKKQYSTDLAATNKQIEKILADFKYTDPKPTEPLGELSDETFVWIDDELPAGANAQGTGNPPWQFVGAPDHPVHSGKKSTVRTGEGDGITQHFFTGANPKLKRFFEESCARVTIRLSN
jgi:mono/diheme cytochrome c family protein